MRVEPLGIDALFRKWELLFFCLLFPTLSPSLISHSLVLTHITPEIIFIINIQLLKYYYYTFKNLKTKVWVKKTYLVAS